MALFSNIQNFVYWFGDELAPNHSGAWVFAQHLGIQLNGDKDDSFYAWVVRSGDVAAVPVPATFWLFGSALIGLFKKKSGNIR